MYKIYLLMFLGLFQFSAIAGNDDESSPQTKQSAEEAPPSIHTLLVEMNKNATQTNQLLAKIAGDMANDGCSRKLQVDTIGLVGNMNRNIQIMTNIMIRMGYNIEELSRTPRKMNDMPFMP